MGAQKLWYLRRDGTVSGPFPRQVLIDYLLLGRLREQDQASLDRINWLPLSAWPELALPAPSPDGTSQEGVDWQLERLAASKRWADERVLADRRQHETAAAEGGSRDRRENTESPETLALRALHQEPRAQPPAASLGKLAAIVGTLVGLTGLGIWLFNPVNPIKVDLASGKPECASAASPNLNWSSCDKSGAWLQGADLSGANLVRAKLNNAKMARVNLAYADLYDADLSYADLQDAAMISADLGHADLSHADLSHADLRGADLRDATLEQTLLNGAIWVDGKVCAANSIDRCE